MSHKLSAPPKKLEGANVLLWAPIDEGIVPSGYCTHPIHGQEPPERAAALAIAVDRRDGMAYYLLHCNQAWDVLADTWHETLELAQRQAEAEYPGISGCWQTRA